MCTHCARERREREKRERRWDSTNLPGESFGGEEMEEMLVVWSRWWWWWWRVGKEMWAVIFGVYWSCHDW